MCQVLITDVSVSRLRNKNTERQLIIVLDIESYQAELPEFILKSALEERNTESHFENFKMNKEIQVDRIIQCQLEVDLKSKISKGSIYFLTYMLYMAELKMSLFQNITEEEKNIIDELRRRTIHDISPKMFEDETLFYRFCKARDFNLKEAENMLRKHIIWRKEMQLDSFLTSYKPPEVLKKHISCNFLCFDKEGCVVRYLDYGQTDMIGLWSSAKKFDVFKYLIHSSEQDFEALKQHSKKIGKVVYQISYIYNFGNLSFANATHRKNIEITPYYLKICQDNYPDRIKNVFIINANCYFSLFFSIIKHILSSALLSKIRCYKADGWKEELLKFIDADDLPAFLGGNKTDPDGNPLCNTFVIHGHKIPESYYLCNHEKKLSVASDVEKLIVARSSKEEINFEVSKVGSILEWEFETKNRDIGFSLYLKENELEDRVELIGKQRIDTCYDTEKGLFKCEKLGIYTIVFDNTYSWIHQKEIYFRARLRVDSEDENQQ
ncbi:SEC14-like protein 4 [Nephila pilipes]|uniref:SEC14-like protein 4 n=1 Tax=Nephila pilipes TaxID=299642 RepID=A0A8X6UUA7_NEPPI|nr:SEC14-like protein 4 [Nephila pilipes]